MPILTHVIFRLSTLVALPAKLSQREICGAPSCDHSQSPDVELRLSYTCASACLLNPTEVADRCHFQNIGGDLCHNHVAAAMIFAQGSQHVDQIVFRQGTPMLCRKQIPFLVGVMNQANQPPQKLSRLRQAEFFCRRRESKRSRATSARSIFCQHSLLLVAS